MTPLVIVGAVALDFILGDPPTALHPVGWMGKLIALFERFQPQSPAARLVWGGLLIVVGLLLSFGLTWGLLQVLGVFPALVHALAGMLLLKMTFAIGGLGGQALKVKRHLDAGRLQEAALAAQSLVSRRTATLPPRLIMAATIESVAENTLDSIVAPLFWFALLGVPGAMAYRFVNTADAMIGYHGDYEHLGKVAARFDDALNWLPARLSFLLIVAGAWLTGFRGASAWRIGRAQHELTESPNAGWTMAAAAGALRVPLEKVGHYRLGEEPVRHLIPMKIADAVTMMYASAGIAAALVFFLQLSTPLGHLPWLA